MKKNFITRYGKSLVVCVGLLALVALIACASPPSPNGASNTPAPTLTPAVPRPQHVKIYGDLVCLEGYNDGDVNEQIVHDTNRIGGVFQSVAYYHLKWKIKGGVRSETVLGQLIPDPRDYVSWDECGP